MRLSDPGRSALAEIGKQLGRTALAQVASVAKPDTILAWHTQRAIRRSVASRVLPKRVHGPLDVLKAATNFVAAWQGGTAEGEQTFMRAKCC